MGCFKIFQGNLTCNSGKYFTYGICWLKVKRANALFGKGHLVNNDLIFIMSNILRGQILQSAWQRPTQPLKFCINQLVLIIRIIICSSRIKKKGKWHFCVFLSCKFKVNWVWYLSWSSAEDKLVKIQGKETETEKVYLQQHGYWLYGSDF